VLTRTVPLSVSNMFSPDHRCEMKKTVTVIIKVVLVLMGRDGGKKVKITGVHE